MNPLKKFLLGLLAGTTLAFVITQHRDTGELLAAIPLFCFYVIGLSFGWQTTMRWTGKVMRLGADLTFWVFFACIFRRGILIGIFVLFFFLTITLAIGCWAGIYIALRDSLKFIFKDRESWKKQYVFPTSEAPAYLLLLAWFSKYNDQELHDDDVQGICNTFPGQYVDENRLVQSLANRNLEDLYQAIQIYKNTPYRESVSTLLSKMLRMAFTSGRVTCQAKEFLYMLAESQSFSWPMMEETYHRMTGAAFPRVSEPSGTSPSSGNDPQTRRALKLLHLPEDFDISRKDAFDIIHQAYREQVKLHHPDLNPGKNDILISEIIEAFTFLQGKTKQGSE